MSQHLAGNVLSFLPPAIHQIAKTHPIRTTIQRKVEQVLRNKHPGRTEWQEKCHEMSLQLEEVLFRTASSLPEYCNEETIPKRLLDIFMTKKVKEARERELLEICELIKLAKFSWLHEVDVLKILVFLKRRSPPLLILNDSSFKPVSGALYHFAAPVVSDAFNWQKIGGNVVETRMLLNVSGVTQVWAVESVDVLRTAQRRTYWTVDNLGGVLVHYHHNSPNKSHNSDDCSCLECVLMQERANMLSISKTLKKSVSENSLLSAPIKSSNSKNQENQPRHEGSANNVNMATTQGFNQSPSNNYQRKRFKLESQDDTSSIPNEYSGSSSPNSSSN